MEVALITGSRGWRDREQIRLVVEAYEVVVVGDARGADRIAAEEAHKADCLVKVFRADWQAHGKRAGPLRNLQMVQHCVALRQEGAIIVCHAFWDGSSRGTLHCVNAARNKGIVVSWHQQ